MRVNARFYISEVRKTPNQFIGVTMLPVTRALFDSEGKSVDNPWAKYSPSGKIEMNVSTESAAASFFEDALGKDLSINFELFDKE